MTKHACKLSGRYKLVCYDVNWNLKWEDYVDNLVTNEGLNHILSSTLDGGTQVTTWYVGLKLAGTAAAADTLASHAGWTEGTSYSGTRKAWVGGTATSQSIDNSASPASFAINGSMTVAGAFLCSVTSGTSGVLYSAGDNTGGNRAVVNTDTLLVTMTFTAADA